MGSLAFERYGYDASIFIWQDRNSNRTPLPEIIREKLKKKIFIIPYWLAAEAASAATDLAEYLGTVIALNLLFGIPMIYAAVFD
jgi:Mn2+/Fe2+ NRAMP family transporter